MKQDGFIHPEGPTMTPEELEKGAEEQAKIFSGIVDRSIVNASFRASIAAQVYSQLIKSRCESDCFISKAEAWKDNCHVWAEDAVYLADVLIQKLNK
jgi:hypothetical protein